MHNYIGIQIVSSSNERIQGSTEDATDTHNSLSLNMNLVRHPSNAVYMGVKLRRYSY